MDFNFFLIATMLGLGSLSSLGVVFILQTALFNKGQPPIVIDLSLKPVQQILALWILGQVAFSIIAVIAVALFVTFGVIKTADVQFDMGIIALAIGFVTTIVAFSFTQAFAQPPVTED